MASKKTIRKKSSQTARGQHLKRALFGLAVVAAITVAVGFWVPYLLRPHSNAPSTPKPPQKKFVRKIPYEVYPKDTTPIRKPVPFKIPKPPPTAVPDLVPPAIKLPRAAIIIDDIGYNLATAEKLIALQAPITFAVLPHSPFCCPIIDKARKQNIEILLHLPMEPVEYPHVDPGPGALLASMSPDELILQLNDNLAAVPSIKGVNNHMGSRLTSDSSRMYQIFTILKKRNLFFIDSLTHPRSVCKPSAKLFRLPFAQRDVFLDNIQDPAAIRNRIEDLIRIAQSQGRAIGIGHPYMATCQALYEAFPDLRKKVELVPASALVEIPE